MTVDVIPRYIDSGPFHYTLCYENVPTEISCACEWKLPSRLPGRSLLFLET